MSALPRTLAVALAAAALALAVRAQPPAPLPGSPAARAAQRVALPSVGGGAAGAATTPATPPAGAAVPRVEVAVAAGTHTVGDPIALTLTVVAPGLGTPPRMPSAATLRSWGDAEVISAGPVAADGPDRWKQAMTVRVFRPGARVLPPLRVALPFADGTREVATAPLSLEIGSVIPADAKGLALEPRPPSPPLPLPLSRWVWATLAALVVLLAAGIWALVALRRRRAATAGEAALPPLAPLPELERALDRLAGERASERLHTGLSLALRRYLGRTLDLHAVEATTTEIHRRLVAAGVPAGFVRGTVRLLRDCDAVKFAKAEPPPEVGAERVAAARGLAGELERHLHPPAPEAGAVEATA